ncbi:MAG: DNA translocase FtsK, partial [Anaerolineaceae bacterium]|nr:DNA translocase FtsK [Anaerolineaceae bacterium]
MACLQSHDLAVQPAGVDLLPRSARLFIQVGRGVKIATVEAREREIRAALGDRRAYVAQDRRGRVYVEIPLPARLARDIAFAGLLVRARRQLEAQGPSGGQRLAATGLPFLLGIDETGRVLLGDLASEVTPHMLVAGTTGSGKTVLLSSIVLSLAALNAQRDLQVALIDGKAFNLARFSRLPHLLAPPATDPDAWPAAVGHVVGEMERRLAASHPITHPHVVLVVDELANVLERWRGLEPELVRLAREGREVGIHGIFATQRPTATVISGSVLANLPCRLVGMCVSGQEASLATGQPQSGAQHLPGRGSFVAVADGGSLTRFQAPLVTDDDIREGLIALQQTRHEQVPPSAGTTNVISFV